MIRIVKLTGKYYGIELPSDDEDAMQEIRDFARQGDPVIIVEDIDDVEQLDIYDRVEMIERSDD
jgi:hypothetical protein